MDKLFTFNEIRQAMKVVKDFKKGFLTNFFPEVDKTNGWIEHGKLYKLEEEETVFFFRDNNEFTYLFYATTTLEALNKALNKLKTMTDETQLVVDIIGKEPEIQAITGVFKENGFYHYTVLNRMSRESLTVDDINIAKGLKLSDTSCAPIILNILNQYFDPIAEQLPTIEEINRWINSNHLIILEEDNIILGFVIFDLIGITSYLRYWFVHPEHRNRKVGSHLLNEYFKRSTGTKRQLFWVIKTNENAIKRYMHYGFFSENLYDYVLTNKNIQYEATNN